MVLDQRTIELRHGRIRALRASCAGTASGMALRGSRLPG
jgi:hypothetical protein